MKNLIILLSSFMLLIFVGCQSADDQRLNQALQLAGNNRTELEKVLNHYSQNQADSLKLEAAKFLIRNMPGHCSYAGESIKHYYEEATAILLSDKSQGDKEKQMNELMKKYPESELEEVQDIQIIKSDYLIKNIDAAFHDWQEGLWARSLSFDDFCEYLLPYKCIDYQTLDSWRDSLRVLSVECLKNYPYNQVEKNSSYFAARAVNTTLGSLMSIKVTDKLKSYPLFKTPLWTKIPSATCGTYSTVAVAAMRSAGIPVTNDIILHWASGYLDHSWVTVFMESGAKGYCEGCHGGIFGHVRPGEYKGKVYRRTYAANKDFVDLNQKASYVPSTLRTWFLKDVTEEYVTPSTIIVSPLKNKWKSDEKYAYIAVFGDRDWEPIGFSKIKDKEITFDKLEQSVIYLPCYFTEAGVEALNYPILIDKRGRKRQLNPDFQHKRDITLKRKYFVARAAYQRGLLLQDGVFQASNKADFSDAVTQYTFDTFTLSGTIQVSDTTAYRYWRYYNPKDTHCNIAEIGFFTQGRKPVTGEIICSEEKESENGWKNKAAAFDLKPLTYFESEQGEGAWIGMDFGSPIALNQIDYMVRSDGNNVYTGDIYELFYWDADGWISAGKLKADGTSVTFRNVPGNTLLLLRDLTAGRDERIFLYENGEQLWY